MSAPFIDWEDAFSNGAYIDGAERFPPLWAKRAADFRASASAELDIAYGDHPRSRFDLFQPPGQAKGLCVIVHGGYWHSFDKSSWSHLAAGALARGWAVALPSYVLAPEARIGAITRHVGAAITAAARRVEGPIRLAGHSAGGHLVTRMLCDNGPLTADVTSRVERVVSRERPPRSASATPAFHEREARSRCGRGRSRKPGAV